MCKNLINLRQSLDRCNEDDLETVDISYDISEKMDDWIQKICISKDKNKKQEVKRREDQAGQDEQLLAMSLNFKTKLDDEASVLCFICHIIKMQPLLSRIIRRYEPVR